MRESDHVGGKSGIRNTRNAPVSGKDEGTKSAKTRSGRRHANTCGSVTPPIRRGSSRRIRRGTCATEKADVNTRVSDARPIGMRSGRKIARGAVPGTPPTREPCRATSRNGDDEIRTSRMRTAGRHDQASPSGREPELQRGGMARVARPARRGVRLLRKQSPDRDRPSCPAHARRLESHRKHYSRVS